MLLPAERMVWPALPTVHRRLTNGTKPRAEKYFYDSSPSAVTNRNSACTQLPENCIVRKIIKLICQGKKRGGKKKGGKKKKTQTQVLMLALTAVPQRVNTDFG